MEAAEKYYELAQEKIINKETALSNALVCTVLATSGKVLDADLKYSQTNK